MKKVEKELPNKPSLVNALLDKLAKEEISIEAVARDPGLKLLLSHRELGRIEDRAYWQYTKYILKYTGDAGRELPFLARARIMESIRLRAYLDAFIKAVLGYLGLAGSGRLPYHQFSNALLKRLAPRDPVMWPPIMTELLEYWTERRSLDPKVAKIVALVTAKACYQLLHGKMRFRVGSPEELYPELEYKARRRFLGEAKEQTVQGGSGES